MTPLSPSLRASVLLQETGKNQKSASSKISSIKNELIILGTITSIAAAALAALAHTYTIMGLCLAAIGIGLAALYQADKDTQKVDHLEKKIKSLQKTEDKLEHAENKFKADEKKLQENLARLHAENQSLKQTTLHFQQQMMFMPKISQQLEGTTKELSHDVKAFQQREAALKADVARLHNDLEQQQKMHATFVENQNKIDKAAGDLKGAVLQFHQGNEHLAANAQKLGALAGQSIQALHQELEALRAEIARLTKQEQEYLAALKSHKDMAQEQHHTIEALKAAEAQLHQTIQSLTDGIQNLQATLAREKGRADKAHQQHAEMQAALNITLQGFKAANPHMMAENASVAEKMRLVQGRIHEYEQLRLKLAQLGHAPPP
jgi:chromosome segregation ATPase